MRQLIVHIGPRKTGSTTIQRLLRALSAPLRAHGIQVPVTGRIGANGFTHIRLAREAARGGHALWWRLSREIRAAKCRCVVLSAEDFSSPPARSAAAVRLAELAARERLDVRIVAYVRPQWQILESEYAQRACGRGVAARFPEFAAELLAAADDTILDYNRVFAPYRDLFGNRVRVTPLQRASMPEGLAAHFLAQVGTDGALSGGAPAEHANVRKGAREVEVWRTLRSSLPRVLWRPRPSLPDLRAVIGADAPFAGFEVDQVRDLETRFASSNRRFARDFGVAADGVLFRDAGHWTRPRQNVADWERFDPDLRGRLRRYLLAELGIDLDGGVWNRRAYLVRRSTVALARRARMAGRKVRSRRARLARWPG